MKKTLLVLPIIPLVFLVMGCSDDSSSPTKNKTSQTTYGVAAAASWFVTSPNVDLSKYSSAHIVVTFQSNVAGDLTFANPPQLQLWSNPDVYDFIAQGDVSITAEPSGTVSPGNTFSYDLTVDLTSVPPSQDHIAIRPTEDNLYGTLGPSKVSVFSSTVTFTQ